MARGDEDAPTPRSEAPFVTLLKFHLNQGTRPYQSDQPWEISEFSRACHVRKATVIDWLQSSTTPNEKNMKIILRVLFGDDPRHQSARAALFAAYVPPRNHRSQEHAHAVHSQDAVRPFFLEFPLKFWLPICEFILTGLGAIGEGPSLGNPLSIVKFITVTMLAAFLSLIIYYSSLISGRTKQHGQQRFLALVERLRNGGPPSAVYRARVRAIFAEIDLFVNQTTLNGGRLGPHFANGRTSSVWHSVALDWCLFFCLAAPSVIMVSVWGATGVNGSTQDALGFPHNADIWTRVLVSCLYLTCVTSYPPYLKSTVRYSFVAYSFSFSLFIALTLYSYMPHILAFIFSVVAAPTLIFVNRAINKGHPSMTGASLTASTVGFGILGNGVFYILGLTPGQSSVPQPLTVTRIQTVVLLGIAVGIALGILQGMCNRLLLSCYRRGRSLYFFAAFIPFSWFICLLAAHLFGNTMAWRWSGVQILFIGFIGLVYAPFYWLNLEFTYILMLRGAEKGRSRIYSYALASVGVSGGVCVLAMIVAIAMVDCFIALSTSASAPIFFLVTPILEGISNDPSSAQYWWIYFVMFFGMLPSIANIIVVGASAARGAGINSRALADAMCRPGELNAGDWGWIAFRLALQWICGAGVSLVALASGVWATSILANGRLFFLLNLATAVDAFSQRLLACILH